MEKLLDNPANAYKRKVLRSILAFKHSRYAIKKWPRV